MKRSVTPSYATYRLRIRLISSASPDCVTWDETERDFVNSEGRRDFMTNLSGSSIAFATAVISAAGANPADASLASSTSTIVGGFCKSDN